jgi:hypothetical protein
MVKVNNHIQADPMPDDLISVVSSSDAKSITRYINPIPLTFYDNENEENHDVMIVDTPGFGDTQGAEVDISNSIGIISSIT